MAPYRGRASPQESPLSATITDIEDYLKRFPHSTARFLADKFNVPIATAHRWREQIQSGTRASRMDDADAAIIVEIIRDGLATLQARFRTYRLAPRDLATKSTLADLNMTKTMAGLAALHPDLVQLTGVKTNEGASKRLAEMLETLGAA